MNSKLKTYSSALLLLLLAFFSFLMLRITLQYIPINLDVAFLRIKQDYINIIPWRIAFFTHVFTSMFALLAGFTQFSKYILKNHKKTHRNIGKLYVFVILFLTGPSGFIMAIYANGGYTSKIGFLFLDILWIYFTAKAFRLALKKDFKNHENYMYRSYALTLSAITLRAWKYILVFLFQPAPMDVYRLVAWLGFIPNLLLIEFLIWKKLLK
ncbi:MAG: DUF2306 domain-containing protein [Chitinophagales bacterium]|nr:DUF2306 domain-containing protein [Chitinophagales bacterium]